MRPAFGSLAAENMDLVIGVGFIFTDDLLTLAEEYPKVHFAGVDLALRTDEHGNALPMPANWRRSKFREEEAPPGRHWPRWSEFEKVIRRRHGHSFD